MNFTEHATHVIAFEVECYYYGTTSSVEAYANIDRALLTWNHDPNMLNASRELFDALLDAFIDFDVDQWAHADERNADARAWAELENEVTGG